MLDFLQRLVDERATDGELGLHVGQPELRILEIEHALAEGPAVAHVVDRQGEGQLGGRQVARCLGDSHVVQHAHDLLEAVAFAPAKQAIAPDAHVLEEELRLVRAAAVQGFDGPSARHSRRGGVDEEDAHTPGAGRCIGLADDRDHRAEVPVGDPGLVAVDHVGVAIAPRVRPESRHVAAGLWLCETCFCNGFPRGVTGQPRLLLLLGSSGKDQVARSVYSEPATHAGTSDGIAHLLVQNDVMQEVAAASTVRLRHAGLKDASGTGLAEHVGREHSLLFPLAIMWLDFLPEEASHRLTELTVIVVEYFPVLESYLRHQADLAAQVTSM